MNFKVVIFGYPSMCRLSSESSACYPCWRMLYRVTCACDEGRGNLVVVIWSTFGRCFLVRNTVLFRPIVHDFWKLDRDGR